MQHASSDEQQEHDRTIALRVRDLASLGRELEHLQRAAGQVEAALENQVRIEVRRRLDRALCPHSNLDTTSRCELEPVIGRMAKLAARKSKLRFDEEAGHIFISVPPATLQSELQERIETALTRVDRRLRAQIQEALKRTVEAFDGLQVDIDPQVLCDLGQLGRDLRATKQKLRELDSSL
jgi:hypothetical protein